MGRTTAFTGLRPVDARKTENPPAATPVQRFVMPVHRSDDTDTCFSMKLLSIRSLRTVSRLNTHFTIGSVIVDNHLGEHVKL
jgi:hypothetical protein